LHPLTALAIKFGSRSLSILTVLAIIVFLRWAHEVLIPITLAILLSYALTPVVRWLRKTAKLHVAVGAALILVLIVGGLGFGLSALQPQALEIVDLAPRAVQKLTSTLRGGSPAPVGAVAKIERAATEIEKAANAAPPAASAVASKPAPAPPTFRIRDYVFTGTMNLVAGVGQFVVVVVLVYFLLIAGDSFRRTLLRISDDPLSRKKITVQMLDEIDTQIQRYLLVQLATSALLGVVAWLVFHWTGLENALTWAVIGAVLHLVPYAGPSVFVALVAVVAFVQFDSLQPVVAIVASLTVSTGIIGLLLVPWLTHRTGTLNAVTVFVTLLVWGWLWGIWGLLLGVPIMMAVKALLDRVDGLRPIGAFLGHPQSLQ
jgi:predicted PurR-regulated permease PerM